MHGFGRQPRCGHRCESARTFRATPSPVASTPDSQRPRAGSTSTTKARAAGTYAGKPSRIGNPGLAATRSARVPTATFGAASATADQRKPAVPPRTSMTHRPIPAPIARRISVRRVRPPTCWTRRAFRTGDWTAVMEPPGSGRA